MSGCSLKVFRRAKTSIETPIQWSVSFYFSSKRNRKFKHLVQTNPMGENITNDPFRYTCSWYTLWSVKFDRLYQHSKSGSFLPLREMACGVHAREIEESTITSVLNECLRDFPHIGELRKEQKTCLVNVAGGKDVFVILPTGFGLAW